MIFLTRDRLHLHVARNGKGRRSGGGGGGGGGGGEGGRLTWQVACTNSYFYGVQIRS